jgi:hypothetical protein
LSVVDPIVELLPEPLPELLPEDLPEIPVVERVPALLEPDNPAVELLPDALDL